MASTLTSINDLNKRVWFRLLKVLYVVAFVVIAVFLLFAAQQSAQVQDPTAFDPSQGVEIVPPQITPQEQTLGFVPDISQPSSPLYHENWPVFSIFAIVALLIETALFWLIRRVFYYVVIGTPVWHMSIKAN